MQKTLFDAPENTKLGVAVDGRARETSGMYAHPKLSYESALFSGVPLYATRLVREHAFTFPERTQVRSPDAVAPVLRSYFESRDREEFVVCLLDTACTLIGLHVASVGGLAASIVEPRQVFKAAVLANAAALIVAHNHPSGRATKRVGRMLTTS